MLVKKKICFVVSSPFTAKVFLLKHFEYLSDTFDIYLVANFQDVIMDFEFVKGVKKIKIERGISLINDAKAILELKKYFLENKFDAVHSVTPKAGLVSMIASKLAKIKVRIHIFTGQVWSTKTGLFKYLLKSIDRLIIYCATDILVDGEAQRRFLIENKLLSVENSKVLGKGSISGADTTVFIPNKDAYYKNRKDFQINDEVVFLFLARIIYEKGIIDLANAFVKINSIYPKTKLVIIGPDEGNLVSKIIEITKGKDVIIKGATNRLLEDLQIADVLCHPSYREGFGTIVIQASLLEKPIICSDTYGLMETIIDNKTGLRHKVGDVDSLFNKMESLMDENLRNYLGKEGRKYVLENFSADEISNHWLNFYKAKFN